MWTHDNAPPKNVKLEAFFWSSNDAMAVVDRTLGVRHANPAFSRVVGDRSLADVVVPQDRERARELLAHCGGGVPTTFEARLRRDGEPLRFCEWTACADPSGELVYVMIRDISRRRRLEQELVQAHKLEAVGQLASGIAHEINTPIQFVGDNLTFIGDSLRQVFVLLHAIGDDGRTAPLLRESGVDTEFLITELPSAVEQACEGIQRVAELVRGMKEFAHHDGGDITVTDLNEALERTIVVSRNEWKYVAQIETALGAVPRVPCTASSMRQVFLNLICNAAHAVADQNKRAGRARGTIRVSTRTEGEWVVVSVADDGTGIPEGARDRIFEPFFTTKPVGRGTGQGLAISNTIVTEKNGGKLTFDTEVGLGTTFHVWLPLRGPAR